MGKEYLSESDRIARADTAIEIMAGMRGTRISRIALEKAKPESERDEKLIARLNRELDILDEERHLMYKGNEEIQDKILTEYSKEMREYFLGEKESGR